MGDLRVTCRQLLRTPAHVATVVASLGVGMAVCGAVFSAVNVVLFSAVPGVVDRSSLVRVRWTAYPNELTPSEFDGLVTAAGDAAAGVAAQGEQVVPVILRGEAASARAAFVSPGLFAMLGTSPILGRVLTPADGRPGAAPVVVIGEALWRRTFDSAPDVAGRSLIVGGRPMVVVGIAPAGFCGLRPEIPNSPEDAPEVWLPLGAEGPHRPWLSVAARLRPGQALHDLQARLAVLGDRLDRVSPPARQPPRLQTYRAGLDWRTSPWDSLLAVGLFLVIPLAVLGIACANVVNLQLARAAERTRELSVRLTLGASRWRVLRLLALEVGVLGIVSAIVGGFGTVVLLRQASAFAALPLPIDTSIVAFFAVLVVVVVATAGLAPAWMASRDLVAAGLRVAPGARSLTRLRSGLVVFQLAVSVVLLFVTTLGVRILRASATTLPPDAANILVTEIDLAAVHQGTPIHARPFVDATLAVLRGHDTIRAAAAATFFRYGYAMQYSVAGAAAHDLRRASAGLATAGWFDANGVRFLAGRGFADDERSAMVISERLSDALGDRSTVLGRRLRVWVGGPPRDVTVTGIVEDTAPTASPMAYLPMSADVPPVVVLTVRARDVAAGRDAVRAALRAADPAVPRDRILALDRKTADASRGFERAIAMMSAIAVLALVLAAAGLFAILAFTVRRRRREIGIRVAVGASRADVVSMVLRQALSLAVIGCAVGLSLAIGVGYAAEATIYGVSPLAATSLLPSVGVLLAIAVLASVPTAWRALRIDPAVTLRDD
jgi:putative ABC transport system permease protein